MVGVEAGDGSGVRARPDHQLAVQDICPGDPSEHFQIGTIDPVGQGLALDALGHDGPADPRRIGQGTCSGGVGSSGLEAISTGAYLAAAGARVARELGDVSTFVPEPPLKCYVTGTCPPSASAPVTGAATSRCTSRRTFAIRLSRKADTARVTVAGTPVKLTRRGGRLTARIDLRGRTAVKVRVKITAKTKTGRTLRQTRTYRTCAAERGKRALR